MTDGGMLKCCLAAYIVFLAFLLTLILTTNKQAHEIRLAKIAAATNQCCNCLQLLDAE